MDFGLESDTTIGKKKTLESHRGQGGGTKPRSSSEQWEFWRSSLQAEEQQHWTSRELSERFYHQTGIRYSSSHWHHLLRHQEKMYYYKPEPRDYRQSEDAETQLLERIKATFDALLVMGKDPKKIAWGFADEVAAQIHSNNARFWAFLEHLPRKVNTTRCVQSFFGWYAIQGNSSLMTLNGGKTEDIKQALLAVKEANKDFSAIVVFWDNAKTHKALDTWGWERGIYFIPLPAYSPNLNPIERLWKSLKKWTNEAMAIKQIDDVIRLFHQGFDSLKSQLSFTISWWEKFKVCLSCYNTIFDSSFSK